MRTADLCRRSVVTATAELSLTELSKLMRKEHVGSVVVVDSAEHGRPVGIVTDRDIVMEVVALELDPRAITAGEIMAASPVVTHEDDDALWALKVMRDRGVRRLPVVDANERLAGIVALDDLMQRIGMALGDVAQVIASERVNENSHRA